MNNNANNQEVWDKILGKDEKVKHSFTIGPRYLKYNLIAGAIICVPFVFAYGFGVVLFLIILFNYGFYAKKLNIYAFTDKRVLIHKGWLSTHMTSIDYSKITDVHVREQFLDKIVYHTGDLAINTAGSGRLEVFLRHIENPYEVKKILDELKG